MATTLVQGIEARRGEARVVSKSPHPQHGMFQCRQGNSFAAALLRMSVKTRVDILPSAAGFFNKRSSGPRFFSEDGRQDLLPAEIVVRTFFQMRES